MQYFPYYIEQMVQAFDRANDPSTNSRKPIFEVKKPSVHKIMDKFYFIAGQAQVFLLSHKRAEGEAFAQKLSPDEINDLQMEPIYVGPVTPEYKTDEKEALELLLKIIAKMNLMQDPEFYSFPLGNYTRLHGRCQIKFKVSIVKICTLAAFLPIIIPPYGCFGQP